MLQSHSRIHQLSDVRIGDRSCAMRSGAGRVEFSPAMVAGRADSGALRPGAGVGVSTERTRAAGSGEGRTRLRALATTGRGCDGRRGAGEAPWARAKGALAWGRISGPTQRIARRGRRTPCRPRSRMRPLCVGPQLRAGDGLGSRRVLTERRLRAFPAVHRRNRQRTKCAGQWAAAAACVGFERVLRARRCKNW